MNKPQDVTVSFTRDERLQLTRVQRTLHRGRDVGERRPPGLRRALHHQTRGDLQAGARRGLVAIGGRIPGLEWSRSIQKRKKKDSFQYRAVMITVLGTVCRDWVSSCPFSDGCSSAPAIWRFEHSAVLEPSPWRGPRSSGAPARMSRLIPHRCPLQGPEVSKVTRS
ncbi:uncharacterized protein WM277_013621 isoform 2-T2 [Molossus nigricans]